MIFFTSYPKRPALPFLTDPIIHGRQASLRPRTGILRKTYRVLFAYLRPALIPNDSHVSNEEFLLFAVRRPRGSLAIRLHIACLLFNSTAWPRVLALNQSVFTAVDLLASTTVAWEAIHEKRDFLGKNGYRKRMLA